jgi:hypothetical protein
MDVENDIAGSFVPREPGNKIFGLDVPDPPHGAEKPVRLLKDSWLFGQNDFDTCSN